MVRCWLFIVIWLKTCTKREKSTPFCRSIQLRKRTKLALYYVTIIQQHVPGSGLICEQLARLPKLRWPAAATAAAAILATARLWRSVPTPAIRRLPARRFWSTSSAEPVPCIPWAATVPGTSRPGTASRWNRWWKPLCSGIWKQSFRSRRRRQSICRWRNQRVQAHRGKGHYGR